MVPVNDAPEAVDDVSETPEDTPVTVAVLENDTDGDGDGLSVVSASAPSHGTAVVSSDGAVLYTPAADYHGPDRFSYTVEDAGGLTASAFVEVTVVPVNDAPEAIGTIPEQFLEIGDPPVTLDLTPYFRDREGDPLTYGVRASNPAVTATLSGAIVTVSGVNRGTASVAVTAQDPAGGTAMHTFAARVSDQRVRVVLEDALAAMGRGHLASARSTLGRRVRSAGRERPRVTLAGYQVPLGFGPLAAAGRAAAERWLFSTAAGMPKQVGRPSVVGLQESAAPGSPGSPLALLGGGGHTEFLLPLGGTREEGEGAKPGRRWTVWGKGDLQTFQGARARSEGYEGAVRTAYVGVDARLTDPWLAGLAVGRSSASSDWGYGLANGRLTTTLTSVKPYVRWSAGGTSVWTMLGGGWGGAENERRLYGLHEESTLGLRLGLVEVRRRLATVGDGIRLQLRGDAAWARLATGGGDEVVDALRVVVQQGRFGVEATRSVQTEGGTLVEPFAEVHARRDGGSGETGAGLELAGGMRMLRGAVRIEGLGRLLVLHSAAGYRERGAGLTLSLGESTQRTGLTLALSPRWGQQATAADALWQEQVYQVGYDAGGDEFAFDARAGYGVQLPAGGLLTPFGVFGRSLYGQRLQAGAVVGDAGDGTGLPLDLQVSGERYSRPGGSADHRVSVLGRITFAGPTRAPAPSSSRMRASDFR